MATIDAGSSTLPTTIKSCFHCRTQKVYSDVLGRQWQTEVLNRNGTVYSTTTNTFNARDQVTLVRQWAGAENGGGAYQDTIMSYDGYGRLKTKHAPEQQIDPNNGASTDHTTWVYNADDTISSVTDARGASATYSYNNRHLGCGNNLQRTFRHHFDTECFVRL